MEPLAQGSSTNALPWLGSPKWLPVMGHPRQRPAGHYISQVMRSVERQQRNKVSAIRTLSSDREHGIMRELDGVILIKSFVVKFAAHGGVRRQGGRGQEAGGEGSGGGGGRGQGLNTAVILL